MTVLSLDKIVISLGPGWNEIMRRYNNRIESTRVTTETDDKLGQQLDRLQQVVQPAQLRQVDSNNSSASNTQQQKESFSDMYTSPDTLHTRQIWAGCYVGSVSVYTAGTLEDLQNLKRIEVHTPLGGEKVGRIRNLVAKKQVNVFKRKIRIPLSADKVTFVGIHLYKKADAMSVDLILPSWYPPLHVKAGVNKYDQNGTLVDTTEENMLYAKYTNIICSYSGACCDMDGRYQKTFTGDIALYLPPYGQLLDRNEVEIGVCVRYHNIEKKERKQ